MPQGKRVATRWLAAGAAALACAGIWVATGFGTSTDSVSEATKAQWQAAYAAAPPMALSLVPAAEVDQAVKTMQLQPQDEQTLRSDLSAGRTRMVWLSFRDVLAEDDDTVVVESSGFSQTVVTKHKSIKVYLPEPESGVVNVRGAYDGGGGITVEITSGGVPLQMPFMISGQVVGVPTVPTP